MSIETYLDDYLLGEIFVFLPENISEISKVCRSFKRAIMNHPILKYVHTIGVGSNLCEFATRAENFELIKYAIENDFPMGESCEIAARAGDIKLLKYLYPIKVETECDDLEYESDYDSDSSSGPPEGIINKECCIDAIKNDNLECLKYLHTKKLDVIEKYSDRLYKSVFENNSFECFKYIYENGADLEDLNYGGIGAAIKVFGLEFIKYYHKRENNLMTKMYKSASKCRNFECVKYLYENKCEIDTEDLIHVVEKMGIKMIELYLTNHTILPSELYKAAINKYNYELLEYLINYGCVITTEIVNYVFNVDMLGSPSEKIPLKYKKGSSEWTTLHDAHVKFIESFQKAGYELNKDNLTYLIDTNNFIGFKYVCGISDALTKKHINYTMEKRNPIFIQYLIEHYELSVDHIKKFSEICCRLGNLDGLKYLIDNNIKLSEECIYISIVQENMACIEYILANGYKWDNAKLDTLKISLKICPFLIHNGYITNTAAMRIINYDGINDLEYLHKNDIKLTKEMCMYAVERKSLKCFKLIMKYGYQLSLEEFSHIKKNTKNVIIWEMKRIVESYDKSTTTQIDINMKHVIDPDEYDCWFKTIPPLGVKINKKLLDVINGKMREFILSDKQNIEFKNMKRKERKYIHMSSFCHGLQSESIGVDPENKITIVTKPDNWKLQLKQISSKTIQKYNALHGSVKIFNEKSDDEYEMD